MDLLFETFLHVGNKQKSQRANVFQQWVENKTEWKEPIDVHLDWKDWKRVKQCYKTLHIPAFYQLITVNLTNFAFLHVEQILIDIFYLLLLIYPLDTFVTVAKSPSHVKLKG